jgi:hypothetical protein
VYDVAVRLLARYDDEDYEVTSWVTGSEIARETGLEKDVVLQALRELGSGRLYVNEAANGNDVEVVGVDHRSTEGGS